jgi:hypothetical protein
MLNKVKDFFKRLYIDLLIIKYGLIFSLIFNQLYYDIYSLLYFNKTYVAEINTPSYGTMTEEVLSEFNMYGKGKIISFVKINKGRPVYIREMTLEQERQNPYTLGMTFPWFKECLIYMRSGLDSETFKDTLLHEYLHCMGYGHTIDKKDLMYYSLYSIDKTENIKQYARKVLRKFYE